MPRIIDYLLPGGLLVVTNTCFVITKMSHQQRRPEIILVEVTELVPINNALSVICFQESALGFSMQRPIEGG